MTSTKSPTGVRKTGLKHTLQHYSTFYQIPLQTILNAYRRKWPLDNPAKLLRHFADAPGHKSDLRTLEQIASGKKPTKQDRNPEPPEEEAKGSLAELQVGLSHEVKRLTEECARSFRDFKNEPSPVHRRSLQRVYAQNVATLQKLVPIASDAEVKAGTLISAADVEATWTRTLLEFRSELDGLPRLIATNVLFAKVDRVAVEELLRATIDRLLERLAGGASLRDPQAPTPA